MREAHNAVNTELAIKKHMHRVSPHEVICQRVHKITLPPKALPLMSRPRPPVVVIEDVI